MRISKNLIVWLMVLFLMNVMQKVNLQYRSGMRCPRSRLCSRSESGQVLVGAEDVILVLKFNLKIFVAMKTNTTLPMAILGLARRGPRPFPTTPLRIPFLEILINLMGTVVSRRDRLRRTRAWRRGPHGRTVRATVVVSMG